MCFDILVSRYFLSQRFMIEAMLYRYVFFFYHAIVLSLSCFSLHFLIHTLVLPLHFSSLSRASFLSHFFPPYIIHEASFIFLWGCFPRIALAQFAWALNIIRVKWDAPLHPFREARVLQYRMTLPRVRGPLDRRKIEDLRWKEIGESRAEKMMALKPRLFINFTNIICSMVQIGLKIFPSKFKNRFFL